MFSAASSLVTLVAPACHAPTACSNAGVSRTLTGRACWTAAMGWLSRCGEGSGGPGFAGCHRWAVCSGSAGCSGGGAVTRLVAWSAEGTPAAAGDSGAAASSLSSSTGPRSAVPANLLRAAVTCGVWERWRLSRWSRRVMVWLPSGRHTTASPAWNPRSCSLLRSDLGQ